MILKILKCIFILHQITVSTCCLSVQEAIDTSLCRDPGLVHPLLGEIHQTVSDRITQGFDKGDLDLYMESADADAYVEVWVKGQLGLTAEGKEDYDKKFRDFSQ